MKKITELNNWIKISESNSEYSTGEELNKKNI
jgi:hypothetical protein